MSNSAPDLCYVHFSFRFSIFFLDFRALGCAQLRFGLKQKDPPLEKLNSTQS